MDNNVIKRSGSATTHYFEQTETLVYNLKLYAKDLGNAIVDNGYVNFSVLSEGDKLTIYLSSLVKDESLQKISNPVLSFSLQEDKLKLLRDNNGYVDLVAAPFLSKDATHNLNPKLNSFSVYQRQQSPDNSQNKTNVFCGRAFNFKELFLGNAFENLQKDNVKFLNISLNKTRLLACTPPSSTVFISLNSSSKSDAFMVNLSPLKPEEVKPYVFKLDMDKVNLCPADVNGNINLSASQRQINTNLKDSADMNIWDNSQYFINKNNPMADNKKQDIKLFVGKGFSALAQKSWFAEKNDSLENIVEDTLSTSLPSSVLEKNGPVSFPLENDFFLNKNFGIGNYQAFGIVTDISDDKVVIDSLVGSFSISKDLVLPASPKDLETFSLFYDNLKDITKQKQIQAVSQKKPISVTLENKKKNDKVKVSSKPPKNKGVDFSI